MAKVFADTSGWAHLFDQSQPYHALAASLYRKARQNAQMLVTTNYVIAELVSLLTNPLRLTRQNIITIIERLKRSQYVKIFHIDETMDRDAWALLRSRPDKEWSLVDCASFILMQNRGIREALTHDHHFEQAGFVRLLK